MLANQKYNIAYLIQSLVAISIGGIIYIIYRTDSLLMFNWFNYLQLNSLIVYLREFTLPINDVLKYSLPDALWVYSYGMMLLFIWQKNINTISFLWIFFIPLIGICSEILQLFGLPGTFDSTDLFLYFIASLLILFQINLINNKKYEV